MKVREQLKEQIIKRMSMDNPWWMTNSIPEDYKSMPHRAYENRSSKEVLLYIGVSIDT